MNILVVTNMYPSAEKKISGIFVIGQVNEIRAKLTEQDSLELYYLKRSFTNKIGSLSKYAKFFLNFFPFILKQKKKFDIVHVHYYFPTIFLALAYKFFFYQKAKIIVTFHGGDIYKKNYNFFYRFPFRYISLCIGVSSLMAEKIKKFFNGDVLVLSAGVNKIFAKKDLPKKYDLIYVGSLYKVKGFDIFCEVLRKINGKLRVLIIGSGELVSLLPSLEESDHEIKYVEFASHEDLNDYYNSSRFLINTSRNESFGLIIAEAMICGVPVIASRTDGSQEQLLNGENGFLCGTVEENQEIIASFVEIVNKAVSLNEEDYQKMSSIARESSQKYKIETVSEKVIGTYKNLLKEK